MAFCCAFSDINKNYVPYLGDDNNFVDKLTITYDDSVLVSISLGSDNILIGSNYMTVKIEYAFTRYSQNLTTLSVCSRSPPTNP